MAGLIAFIVGWLAAGIIGWPYIKAGFDTGSPSAGVGRFILLVFGVAIVCGLVGMLLGAVGGVVWESMHRNRRSRAQRSRVAAVSALASVTPGGVGPPTATGERRATARTSTRVALPVLQFTDGDLDARAYIALAARVGGDATLDPKRIGAALARTINVAAWDGERLVGVARLLSDGYAFAALADIFVDPDYQRRGLGSELLNRAFERTPRGAMLIGSPLASSGFFDRIGCERGPTGFTMRRATRRANVPTN